MKTAVLFPGIGYHCDKPLLYYAGKLARAAGYEVLSVPYTGFPKNIRNDREKIREAIALAVEQTEQILMGQKWSEQADILFISKSIGTVAASQYAMDKGLSVRSILFTPLPEAFEKAVLPAIAFHGTADPWAETGTLADACQRKQIPLYRVEGANHSLETGDVMRDLQNLQETMKRVRRFIGENGQ